MKITVVGLQKAALVAHIGENYPGLTVVEKDADVIVCYGGDGTLLWGERHYPGVPKVMVRNSRISEADMTVNRDTILQLISQERFQIEEHMKLSAVVGDTEMLALNDIVIGHPHVNGSVRFRISINGREFAKEVLADGVVVSTPVGSTGYFQSIAHTNFEIGLGVAFNNAINPIKHLVLNRESTIQVEITRGPGRVAPDNDEEEIQLSTGDHVTIAASEKTAKALRFPEGYEHLNLNIGMNRTPLDFH
jgi:NAD kinase